MDPNDFNDEKNEESSYTKGVYQYQIVATLMKAFNLLTLPQT